MSGRSGPRVKALAELSAAVTKVARYTLPGHPRITFRTDPQRSLPGEALLAALQENA